MSHFALEAYDDEVSFEKRPKKQRTEKNINKSKPKGKINKRMCHKLENSLDKEAVAMHNDVEQILTSISTGAAIQFKDESRIVNEERKIATVTIPAAEKTKNQVEKQAPEQTQEVKQEYKVIKNEKTLEVENICKIFGMHFITDDKMVIRLFQDPIHVPIGSRWLITDQYFENGCVCKLEQIIKRNGIMFVFKREDTNGITTYTTTALREAQDIRFIK